MRENKHKAHVLLSLSGSPGGKCERTRVFPGIISAQKVSAGEVLTYTNPRPAVEEGANACPSEVGERRENASPRNALEGGCATGTAADGFAQVKECAAEPVAAAEGDRRGQAQQSGCTRCWVGDAGPSMKNRLVDICCLPRSDRFKPLILLMSADNIFC